MLYLNHLLNEVNLPSRIDLVETSWTKKAGIDLYLKRDDLIHPKISGNKIRKLIGWLKKHERDNVERIMTFGGPYSNHLIATAYAANLLGVESAGFVRGNNHRFKSQVLEECEKVGMHLSFLDYDAYDQEKDKGGLLAGELKIPEGGAGELGFVGFKEMIAEVSFSADSIVVPCGTGTTAVGIKKAYPERAVFGFQALKGEKYIQDHLLKEYGVTELPVFDQYHFGGYAKTNNELITFISNFKKDTSILLDPIYTGKMMFGLSDQLKTNPTLFGKKILAIHTGGLTGWYGKKNEYAKI